MPTPEKSLCKVFKKLESKFKIHSNFGKRWNSAVADICLLTTQLTAEKGKKMPPLFLSSWLMETLLKFLWDSFGTGKTSLIITSQIVCTAHCKALSQWSSERVELKKKVACTAAALFVAVNCTKWVYKLEGQLNCGLG